MLPMQLRSEDEIIATWKGNEEAPLVSIKCLTYNHRPYIEDAIKSFLSQITDFPIEVWIHDDASTDGTDEIVKQYCAKYPRIVKAICQTENQYSKGERVGVLLSKRCRGEYVALCEGDDYWLGTDKLVKQIDAMRRHPDSDLCVHPGLMLDVKNNTTYEKYWHGAEEKVINVEPIASSLSQFSPTASYFFKRKAYDNMPSWFFNAKNIPFGDYFVETIIGKNGVIYIPDFYCVYRRNVPGSYTVRTQAAKVDVLIERLKKVVTYTNKLYGIPEIPNIAIKNRLKVVHEDYLNMAVARKSHIMAQKVILSARNEIGNDFAKEQHWHSPLTFYIYSSYKVSYRKLKRMVKKKLPRKK